MGLKSVMALDSILQTRRLGRVNFPLLTMDTRVLQVTVNIPADAVPTWISLLARPDMMVVGQKDVRDTPQVFFQWKGTDVCADVYCECGAHSHFDGDFFYYFKCPVCGAVYEVPGVQPLKRADPPKDAIVREGGL